MARLTWQNVDSPDFRGVADSYRVMSQLLSNATDSGLAIADTFKNANAEAADRAILQRMVGVQDPSQFDPNAIIGAEGSRASLDTLKGVGNYAGTLLDRAIKGDDRNFTQYGRERLMSGNQTMDANADVINTARSLAVSGDMAGAQRLLSSVAGLRPEQHGEILGNIEQFGTRALGRDVTRLNMDVTGQGLTEQRYGFGNTVRSDQDTRAANEIVSNALRVAGTPSDARVVLEEQVASGEITPEAFMKSIAGLSGMGYGNVYAPSQMGGGVGPAPGASASPGSSGFALGAPQKAVATSLGSTFSPEVTAGFLGNFHAEGGYTGGQGDGGSAGGIVQWRKERRDNFKTQIGKDPTQATPEEQMEFVKWEMANPEKAGMTIAQRDAILAAKDPATAARLIDQYYERSDGKHRDRRASAAADAYSIITGTGGTQAPALPSPVEAATVGEMVSQSLAERTSQTNAAGISADYGEALNRNRSPVEVASTMVSEGGALAGTNQDFVLRQVNEIVSKSGGRISPDVAGEMIERSLTSAGGAISKGLRKIGNIGGLANNLQPTLANNQRIDQDTLDSLVESYDSGAASEAALLNQYAQRMKGVEQQAVNAYNTAVTQYQQAVLAASTDPRLAQTLPRYRAVMEQANAQLRAVRQQVAQDPALKPKFRTTEPEIPIPIIDRARGGGGGAGR